MVIGRGRSGRGSRRRGAAGLAAALLLLSPLAALGQGLGVFSGGSGPLDGTLAEREPVLERVEASFVREQVTRIDEARRGAGDALVEFDPGDALEESRRAFLEETSRTLYSLQGDGSLTLGEVAGEMPSIRDRHLRRFEDVVEAMARGYPPPPLRTDFDSSGAYLLAQARYTLLTRNPPSAWARLAACAGVGALLALVLSRLLRALSKGVSRHELETVGSALDSIRVPLILAAAAGGLLVGLRFLWLPAAAENFVATALVVAIVGLAFLACWRLCDEIAGAIAAGVRRATGRESVAHMRRLIQRALRVLVIVAFLVVVSRLVLGVSLTGLLAGLGIIGVGLWFLTRGLVENVAASFTLFGDRVFRIGDTVIHQGEWGVIEDIGFRSTRCRTLDGHMLHIPNRNLVDDTIRNVSARPYLRSRFRLSIVYDTPPAKVDEAIAIARETIESHGDAVDLDEGVNVVFEGFGEHDLRLLVQYYTASDDYWSAKETMSRVNRALLHRFEEAGIAFAFPTQTTLLATEAREPFAVSVEGRIERREEGATDDGEPEGDEPAETSGDDRRRGSPERTRRDGFDEEAREEGTDDAAGDGGER